MERHREPPTRGGAGEARDLDAARHALTKGWATTRWIMLVLACGVGFASIVAVAFVVLITILQESI